MRSGFGTACLAAALLAALALAGPGCGKDRGAGGRRGRVGGARGLWPGGGAASIFPP